ncbi:hypothetical protein ACHQM5_001688 [Ranunculus cassubicifolius]
MGKKKSDLNIKDIRMKTKNKNKKSSAKKLVSGLSAVLKSKPPKENPFENIWSRTKFDVLGKKRKGEEKRTGLSRSLAIDKRKSTLLKEYEQSGKSSVFLDKRIGEQNESLGEFDKAILRSQRERQVKVTKKSKYNLSDGEEDGDEIYGGMQKDDFEEEFSADEDGDEMSGKAELLKHIDGHNMYDPTENGKAGEENKHKSKKEVMEEIILKSKYFKAQKSKEKDENIELMEQLDKDFASLVQSQALAALTQPSKMNALKALVNKGSSRESTAKDEEIVPLRKEPSKQEKPDTYDKLVKEMALDMRARPSDRTKTPEEIALEEKERLEQLEAERQERMRGKDVSSDDEDNDTEVPSAKKLRSVSGDDLGDSFSLDEELGSRKGWVDAILERDANDIDDEEEGSSEDSESDGDESDEDGDGSEDHGKLRKKISLKDWEQSDDDELSTDLEDDDEEDDEESEEEEDMDRKTKGKERKKAKEATDIKVKKADTSSAGKTKVNGKLTQGQDDALPFIIEAPTSLEELSSLLDKRSDLEVAEAINRIRVCNAISLVAENRKKMQVFYGVLLQYFAVVANKKLLNFKLLNLLVKPLMEMSTETPFFAAICARQRIHQTRAKFCEDIKDPEKSSWPSMKTLFLLRLWSMIFPCSDFRHVVMTPAILLMCEYLMRCPITSGRDIAIGSFLCSIVLSVTRQSQKFCPEAIIYLRTLLISALTTETSLLEHSQFHYLPEHKMLKPWLRLHSHVSDIESLDFFKVMEMEENSSFFSSDSFRASVLITMVETLRGFVNVCGTHNSFPEIFSPISTLLHELVKQDNMPSTLQDSMRSVCEEIEKKTGEHYLLRVPLQMRKQKPVAIKLLAPKFEENFVKGRDYDPDRERAELKKLQKKIKREAKGAARELRKDKDFLFGVKEKERKLIEEERSEKYGKARAFLQEQEQASKSGQLGKGKGSKRRR